MPPPGGAAAGEFGSPARGDVGPAAVPVRAEAPRVVTVDMVVVVELTSVSAEEA